MLAPCPACEAGHRPSRRSLLKAFGTIAAVTSVGVGGAANTAYAYVLTKAQRDKLTPDQILALMEAGNRRFYKGRRESHDFLAQQRASAKGHHPAAVLLSCIDSRAPAETIMDLRIGDVFNCRVAGNVENPDILATISKLKEKRPGLVIGFAAETEHLIDNAKAKLKRKGCDWIVANDVSPSTGTFGGDRNTVHLIRREGSEISVDDWPIMTKDEVAVALIAQIVEALRTPE